MWQNKCKRQPGNFADLVKIARYLEHGNELIIRVKFASKDMEFLYVSKDYLKTIATWDDGF